MSNASDFIIENGVLKKYVGPGGDVVIPEDVTEIGRRAFGDNCTVITITCPENLQLIGAEAFYGCAALTTAQLLGVTEIGSGAFYGCKKLTDLTISDCLRVIGNIAFSGCSELTHVVIPEKVEQIGWGAFQKCALKQVVVPKSVKVLQHEAFSGCPNITIYDTVDPDAGDCQDKIDLVNGCPNSEVGFIGVGPAFAKWSCVSNHRWIDHVITVLSSETGAVKYKVHMEADPGQKNYQGLLTSAWGHHATFAFEALDDFFPKIKKGKMQVALSRLTYRTALTPEMEQKYTKYICKMAKDVLRYCIDSKDMNALLLCANAGAIKANNIEDALLYATQKDCTEIVAFLLDYKNKHIAIVNEQMTLSETPAKNAEPVSDEKLWTVIKQSDGSGLISRYNGKETEITFPTEIAGIKIRGTATRRGAAPDNYKKLTSVKIPEGYVVIGNKTFEGCEVLKNIELAATVQQIGHEAFAGCKALESIILPPLLRYIDAFVTDGGKQAFRDCTALKDVFVTSEDMYIYSDDAFKGCNNYKIHASEISKVYKDAKFKRCEAMPAQDLRAIAPLYYGIPRKRTIVCTGDVGEYPEIGECMQLQVAEITKEIRGHQLTETVVQAVSDNGIVYGIPMMDRYDLYGGEIFGEDLALQRFAEYLSARVVSNPRKYKKHKCFDVEISISL